MSQFCEPNERHQSAILAPYSGQSKSLQHGSCVDNCRARKGFKGRLHAPTGEEMMNALPTTIHWAMLYPLLAIYIGAATLLTGVIRDSGGERWSILVPISGVLLLAGAAFALAQAGVFCAFCR